MSDLLYVYTLFLELNIQCSSNAQPPIHSDISSVSILLTKLLAIDSNNDNVPFPLIGCEGVPSRILLLTFLLEHQKSRNTFFKLSVTLLVFIGLSFLRSYLSNTTAQNHGISVIPTK